MVRIYNGFDFDQMAKLRHQLDYREERGWSRETLIVSLIADLVEWKRHDLFIAAFAELRKKVPDAFAFIIGAPRDDKGEVYEQRLLALSEELGQTAHIAFTGHVENPFPLIDASNLMVSVAEDEPFGRNVVEALFCGKPMVITPGGGPAEIAGDCPAVTIAEPTPIALAEAMYAWHVADRNRLVQVGDAAHRAALRFDLPRHLRQVGEVLDGVLAPS
jgi:glycosyltransferase involved in cell wall biosynthesis